MSKSAAFVALGASVDESAADVCAGSDAVGSSSLAIGSVRSVAMLLRGRMLVIFVMGFVEKY